MTSNVSLNRGRSLENLLTPASEVFRTENPWISSEPFHEPLSDSVTQHLETITDGIQLFVVLQLPRPGANDEAGGTGADGMACRCYICRRAGRFEGGRVSFLGDAVCEWDKFDEEEVQRGGA